MAKKRWFVEPLALSSARDIGVIVMEGSTVVEVEVVRRFKAKYDDKNRLIIPETK